MTTLTWKAEKREGDGTALEFCILVKSPHVILTGAALKSQSRNFKNAFIKISPTGGYRRKAFSMTRTSDTIYLPALSLEQNNAGMRFAVKQFGKILPAYSRGKVQNDDGKGGYTWASINKIPIFDFKTPAFIIIETSVRLS